MTVKDSVLNYEYELCRFRQSFIQDEQKYCINFKIIKSIHIKKRKKNNDTEVHFAVKAFSLCGHSLTTKKGFSSKEVTNRVT